ncbi:MAG: DUF4340 domain-containing protein [Oscillospiraceae bacterium]
MKKKLILLGVAVLVVAGLVVALVLLNGQEPVAEESSQEYTPVEVNYILGGENAPAATEVTIKNQYGEYTIYALPGSSDTVSGSYAIKGMEDYQVTSLSSLMTSAKVSSVKSVVTEKADDLGVFGLTNPQATVSIKYEDNTSATLLIGDAAPAGEGYYAKRGDSDTVYLLSPSTGAAKFLDDKLTLMDKTLTGGTAGSDEEAASQFGRVELGGTVRGEEPVIIEALPEDEVTSASGMVLTSHRIVSPIRVNLAYQRGSDVLAKAFGLVADKVVDAGKTPENLAKYGLEEPYSTISIELVQQYQEGETIKTMTIPYSLQVSAPQADGSVYLVTGSSELIYQIQASALPWLESTAFDLMDRMIVMPFIDKVASIKLEGEGVETSLFNLSGESSDLVVQINDSPVDTANFRAYYQTLIGTSYDSIPEEELPEDAREIFAITYNYREGGADVVKFYEGPSRKVYATLNDGDPYLVLTSYLDRIKEDLGKILAGEDVKSFL